MNKVKNLHYAVEFNGYDYVVLLNSIAVAAFATSEDAFKAKRSFEDRPTIKNQDKTPPAMRAMKQALYGHVA